MLIRPEESGIVMLIIGTVLSLFVWCPDTRWCHGDMMSPSWVADATMNNYGLWVSSISAVSVSFSGWGIRSFKGRCKARLDNEKWNMEKTFSVIVMFGVRVSDGDIY